MGKRTDLIELDSSENVHANGIMPKDCVIMAGFRDFEKGDGYEKFQEITYESLNEFNNEYSLLIYHTEVQQFLYGRMLYTSV